MKCSLLLTQELSPKRKCGPGRADEDCQSGKACAPEQILSPIQLICVVYCTVLEYSVLNIHRTWTKYSTNNMAMLCACNTFSCHLGIRKEMLLGPEAHRTW